MQKVTESIINIGIDDREIPLFEGQYEIEKGMAYNSYVILDEKVAVMDTVDAHVTGQWLQELDQALNGRKVDYLIVQHMEPDHGGSIRELADRFPDMKIVASTIAVRMLDQFFDGDMQGRTETVKEGDTLSLGSHTLQFYTAAMVHWPEVLVTYEQSEQIMFSADAFGKFGTRDADEEWAQEARRYYINICGKYGVQVQALLKKLSGLSISAICSLHGPVLTENLGYYIDKYNIWSSYAPEKAGVFIAYASIYGHTRDAALKLRDLLQENGVKEVAMCDLCRDDLHEAVSNAFCYDRLVLAAVSYDSGLFPAMETLLRHLKAKNYQKRMVALIENGSWGPCAAKEMRALLETMKEITVAEPVVTIKSAMKPENVAQLEELAGVLAGSGNKNE